MLFERWLYTVPLRLRSLFRRNRVESELDEELRFHVERLTEEHVIRGLSRDDARLAALRAMDGLEQRKEECRDARRVRVLEDLMSDVRYGGRALLRNRGFAAAAIGTLALGIGATIAVFTVVDGVLLRPMPFAQPDRLFLVTHTEPGPFMAGPGLSDRTYLAFKSADRTFEHLAAFSSRTASMRGPGDPAIVQIAAVTTEFFAALRVAPATGHAFDDGSEQSVLLSDALWRSRFAADPAIVDKVIALDGVRRAVVGVMPAGFDFPNHAQAWIPQTIRTDPHMSLVVPVLGRLRPGVTVAQARAEFEAFTRHLDEPAGGKWVSGILPLKELLVADTRRPLGIFAASVVLVLLITCANVASLLLARASGRQREMAVRAALGASRRRLIRQLLTESALVSLAGGACAIVLARWGVPALLALAPEGKIPRIETIAIDGRVLIFAIGVSLVTGLIFGVAPALRMTRRGFHGSLAPSSRTFFAGQERLRATLVTAEIALAVMLLVGAGLLLKSFLRLQAVDLGFRPDQVITLTVDLPETDYPTAQKLHAFHEQTLARLSGLPDVVSAGAINWRPLGTVLITGDFQVEGGPTVPDGFIPDKPAVSPGYFAAMGIRVLRGRDFTTEDTASSANVAVVSRTVARFLSGSDENAIGRRVSLRDNPAPEDWLTVVGIVDDVRQWGPHEPAHAAIYQPYLQVSRPFFINHMSFAIRTAADPLRLAPAIRSVLRDVDRNQPAQSIVPMTDVMSAATAEPAFQARLLTIFASLALILAAVGIYGVVAYAVSQRTQEIGVRMALGAQAGTVVWMVLGRTLLLSAAGVALGACGALAATRILATLLFEITPTDPATFSAVASIILLVALAAAVVPALRAARIDPVVALRND
jgi:putative ABC transport system permease protein